MDQMGSNWLDIPTLAHYLGRDARDVERLAEKGRLPAQRVGGEWRFSRDEINHWLEKEMGTLSDRQLADVEVGVQGGPKITAELEPLVSKLLTVETMAVPMDARTAPGVLQKLVETANATWHIYMPEKVLAAVKAREDTLCTVMPGGVAIPHPRRPMPDAIGESTIAFGRTSTGIPFGERGELADLFFLILCRDDRTHLQTLARLSRMLQRPGFLEALRDAGDAKAAFECIRIAEGDLLRA